MENKKEEQKEEEKKPEKKEISLTIFLFLLITSIIKDAIEILLGLILGLIPGINLFVWIISLPFTLFIFAITFMSGIRAEWLFIGQILDLVPFASILPIATLTVILCYIFQKLPAPLKKTAEKASKLTSLKSLETKI